MVHLHSWCPLWAFKNKTNKMEATQESLINAQEIIRSNELKWGHPHRFLPWNDLLVTSKEKGERATMISSPQISSFQSQSFPHEKSAESLYCSKDKMVVDNEKENANNKTKRVNILDFATHPGKGAMFKESWVGQFSVQSRAQWLFIPKTNSIQKRNTN